MTDRFTLAHFTDAHLPLHGRFRLSDLRGKRILSALNWTLNRRKRHVMAVADALKADLLAHAPDHVAMTGDVVNFGLAREFPPAADWLRDFGDGGRLSFVPGNHENLRPGVANLVETTFAEWTGREWPWVKPLGPVTLIGVSSSVPSPPGFAQGEAGAAQIARLKEALKASEGATRVILIHHPPTEMSKPRKALCDRAAICAAIAGAGAELILHGHNHKNELSWIDRPDGGRIPVLGAPSASCPPGLGQAAEWRLIEFSGTEIRYRRRAFDGDVFADRGSFVLPSA